MTRFHYINRRFKIIQMLILATILFLLLNLYYVNFIRNILLGPVLPPVWRTVNTADILMMQRVKLPQNVTYLVTCPEMIKPGITLNNISTGVMLKYNRATADNPLFQKENFVGFLPGISDQERVDTLLLYQVFAETMARIGVDFFFTGGSLLGVLRHGGSIPWDTDIDIALNGSEWKSVKDGLSCLEEYRLQTEWHMHWKFFFKGRAFPFIDLFFFAENDIYLWAMNHYTLKSILYKKEDVFPLTSGRYEGLVVPVPKHIENIVRSEFDIEYCYPPSTNHKTGRHFRKTVQLCSAMGGVYPMQNLRF